MANRWPALVVTSGPQAGQRYTLGAEHLSLGRSPDADIRLVSHNVSREHLRVVPQGSHLLVHDLGSANGTYVNGSRLTGTGFVGPGGMLRVGDVEMQYIVPDHSHRTDPTPAPRSFGFGDVGGPVNVGDPVNYSGNQVVGSGSIHHGSVHHGDKYELDFDNGLQELFSGRGPGRVIMGLGLILAIVGFGIWMSVIFSFMPGDSGATPPNTFEKEMLGLNAAILGFALFGGGGVLSTVGASMSKAARQRAGRRRTG